MAKPLTIHSLQHGILPEKTSWRQWEKHVRTAAGNLKAETSGSKDEPVEVDFAKFTPKKYLLSWATIVGGVEPDTNGYYIVPEHSQWINDNGNAWLNQVLLESYKSFIWAENYLEHVQVPILSKGKILDAVAWVARDGKVPTVFVDILVATNKEKHPKLVASIQSGKMTGLSMGCNILFSQCSRCGKVFEEGEDEPCKHIKENLGRTFEGTDGKKHIQAELCGVPGQPGSCVFTEASWVKVPAFKPAIRHDGLKVGNVWKGKPLKAIVPKGRLMEAAKEDEWL